MIDNEKNYVELPVTGGYVTKVDPDIADRIKGKKLYKFNNYVGIFHDGNAKYFHRFVLNFPKHSIIDHINGDRFDNRKNNLRITSYSINAMNIFRESKSFSGFRGVSYFSRAKMFFVSFNYNKKRYKLGYFRNRYVASIIKDIKVKKTVKEKVSLNYRKSIQESDIPAFIEKSSGRIFKLCFVKRTDGSFRELICRSGVSKNINGKGMAFNPADNNLSVVYDMQNKSYKCVPLENIVCIKFKKENYLVTRKRLVA